MRTTPRSAAAAVGILLTTAALASCAGGAGDSETTAATAAAGGVDLSDVCPATVVVQTDWNPEADHGHLYELVGKGYTVDANQKSVTGDLVSGGKPTGVKIEVRAGGPAIGFTQASAQMYQDTSITLGYVSTDEAVQLSGQVPDDRRVRRERQVSDDGHVGPGDVPRRHRHQGPRRRARRSPAASSATSTAPRT